jgi:uncharacterized protein YecE (DUF72 family)
MAACVPRIIANCQLPIADFPVSQLFELSCDKSAIGNWQLEMIYVGTSGYSYKEWKGSFYPEKIPAEEMLSYYAEHLQAVELNNTFYRLPRPGMVEAWKAQVPDNFRFTVKAPQTITHFRRLKDAAAVTQSMLKTVSALEHRLGAVFFRFPEDMTKDLERLETFLKDLSPDIRATFEFRHPSWFDDDVLALLRSHNRALCISDRDEMPMDHIDKTADWGYLRLRRVNYLESDLLKWIKRVRAQHWKDTYVFFKHDDEATGPKLAAQFVALSQPQRHKNTN